MDRIDASLAWLPGGWRPDARIVLREGGRIASVDSDPATHDAAEGGLLLPGLHNLHSHAFQRAMAGLAERRSPHGNADGDSFWTWRDRMYQIAARVGPDALRAIACQLYAEMLEAGYTSVCEFHYLHHPPEGGRYADPAAMSRALVDAARDTGIGLLMLPVLYMHGGFDGRPLQARQQRFGNDVDSYLALLDALAPECDAQVALGIAFHSLRAVPEAALREVLAATATVNLPLHIHIAEQAAEVEESLALRGRRPVRWLLDEVPVDRRWTLVHATHVDAGEVAGIAGSGATVALCPSTEGNLGDGLFPFGDYISAGGHWGIGSDSHVSVSPVEELRWLEYGQRLLHQRRCVAATSANASVGESLLVQALVGGERASGRGAGRIEAGALADLVRLDAGLPAFAACDTADLLDAWIFSGNRPAVDAVWVAGRQCVAGGRHLRREHYAREYREALRGLRD